MNVRFVMWKPFLYSCCYLLPCVLALLSGPAQLSSAYRRQAGNSPLSLSLMDANGVPVVGIVCDNLRDMPDAMRDCLIVPLPESLRGVPLTCALTDANPVARRKRHKRLDASDSNNTGTIRQENDRLIYFPPDEFNSNPEPQHLSDIQRENRRVVLLTVRRTQADSGSAIVAQQPIVLARPPLVAVHGINSSTTSPSWIGKDRLPDRLRQIGIAVVYSDHGRHDFNPFRVLATPAREFHGNGPVEEAAQQLEKTVAQTLQDVRQNDHLAIRRIDVLGYSYGGLIARWYLHQFRRDPSTQNSLSWYVRSANMGAPHPLYRIDPAWYGRQETEERGRRGEEEKRRKGEYSSFLLPPSSLSSPSTSIPVRKLITVASMWRGVPLCNYVNEIHAPHEGKTDVNGSGIRLANAPLLGQAVSKFVDGSLAVLLPTRVPSMEVMAVNSPWLTALNNFVEDGQRKPCVESVAYGCVAGDDNAFLPVPGTGLRTDPYSALRLTQIPSWFPYLALERHPTAELNYSDGLVPLWSGVIADNFDLWRPTCVVRANHDSILSNKQALEYVACALNHRACLPSGRMLNARWGHAITSRELAPVPDATAPQNSPILDYVFGPPQKLAAPDKPRRVWTFQPGDIAPHLQNRLYPQIERLGRIAPDALREIRTLRVEEVTRDSAIVSWHTAGELNGFVAVTHWEQVNFSAYDDREVNCRIEPIGPRVTCNHRFRLSGLQPNTTYRVRVTSEAESGPEDVIAVRCGPMRFTTRQ